MLGFNSYESDALTDTDSATLVQVLRQASKNIMYTVEITQWKIRMRQDWII